MADAGRSLGYVPGLDGLRAVAVAAVLLYHGGVGTWSGGFLGVDVFFALSGFLITSLLLAEWDRTGRLALGAFWLRRARRLLPALALLIVAVGTWAWLVAGSDLLDRVRRDGLASLLYISNWVFISTGDSYFDQFTLPSPFRHTWSLAIEEQFYLVFPFAFIAAMRLLRRRRWIAVAFALGAVGSAAVMAALVSGGSDPSRAYYGTDARLQTLLVGAVLAVLTTGRTVGPFVSGLASVLGLAGSVALLAAFALVSDRDLWMYRGGFLLVALASCSVIAAAVLAPRSPIAALLSLRPFVALGVISYGLYLWHWPVFMALTPATVGLTGWPLFALRALVSVVIAAASYRFVEHPIRAGALSRLRPRQRVTAIAAAAVATVTVLLVGTVGAQAAVVPGRDGTQTAAGTFTGSTAGKTTVFMLGDSQALGLRTQFPQDVAPELAVTGSTQLGCGLFPVTMAAEGKVIEPGPPCRDWFERRESEIAAASSDIGLVFAGSWEQYDTLVDGQVQQAGSSEWHSALVARYRGQLELLKRHSGTVGIVLDHCHLTPDVGIGPEPRIVNDISRVELVNAAAREAASSAGFPVTVIDVQQFLCPTGFEAERDGVLLRVDGLHFTPEGARIVWEWLAPQLKQMALAPTRS